MRLSEASSRFLEWAKVERNLAEPSLRAYTSDLRFLTSGVGDVSVDTVTVDLLRHHFSREGGHRGYSPATIRRRIATAKVFFGFLETDGIVVSSPTRAMRGRYELVRRLPKVMARREVSALLRAARRPLSKAPPPKAITPSGPDPTGRYAYIRDICILEILFLTGLRVGELVALDVPDVSLPDGSIRVLGKGRRERYAYLPNAEVSGVVDIYLRSRRGIQCETAALFLNSRFERMSIFSVEGLFEKYCRKAKIRRHYTPHCLRHTMATMLLENGADIRVVQELLGHRTIVTTQIYTEVCASQKRRALVRFSGRNSLDPGPMLLPPVRVGSAASA
jgi:integrase/recombinase XerD